MTIAWQFADTGREYALSRANGVLRHRARSGGGRERRGRPDQPHGIGPSRAGAAQPQDLIASGELVLDGDAALFAELLGLLDPPDPSFAVVTP